MDSCHVYSIERTGWIVSRILYVLPGLAGAIHALFTSNDVNAESLGNFFLMLQIEDEIWRMVPPEEKFELMARAQSKGVSAAALTIVILSTIAVGLRLGPLLWIGIILAPFVFQVAAGKEWRSLRPRTLLEYLAARSASRRFAFSSKAKDLTASMIFKGTVEQVYDKEHVQEAMEAVIENNAQSKVWIALFGDAFTMITEKPGGAELKIGQVLDNKVKIYSESPGGEEYTNNKSIMMTLANRDGEQKTYRITSRYPAALIVFEKRMKQIQSNTLKLEIPAAFTPEMTEDAGETSADDKFNNLFSF